MRTVLCNFTRRLSCSVMFENVCDVKVWTSLGVMCYVLLAKACQLGRGWLMSAKSRFLKKKSWWSSLHLFTMWYIELNAVVGVKKVLYMFFFSSVSYLLIGCFVCLFSRLLDSFYLSTYLSQIFFSPCISPFWVLIISFFILQSFSMRVFLSVYLMKTPLCSTSCNLFFDLPSYPQRP